LFVVGVVIDDVAVTVRGAWQDAHFGQFVTILGAFEQLRHANWAFGRARPVIASNVRPSERDPGCPLVTDPTAKRVTDRFDVCYEILPLAFQRFFARPEESDAQLAALADATVALMVRLVRPLGDLITTLPAGPEYPDRTAGPSFELFYEVTTCSRTATRWPGTRSGAHDWPAPSPRAPPGPRPRRPDATVSFEAHVKPLFRSRDRESMICIRPMVSCRRPGTRRRHRRPAPQRHDALRRRPGAGETDLFERWAESGFQP